MNRNWQNFIGTQTLADYSEIGAEAQSTKPQLIDLSSMGLLKVSGEDNKKFLQGQLTCDVEAVTESVSCLGTYCNLKGRAISSFRVFQRGADIYLIMDRALLAITKAALAKYIVFSKADMSIVDDSQEDLFCFALAGKDHLTIVEQSILNATATQSLNTCVSPTINPDELSVIQHHELITLIVGPSKSLIKTWEKLSSVSQAVRQNQWDLILIESGVAQITAAASELFIPLELHLQHQGFINFDKGCYTGQEIIARLHYRGKLKQSAFICHASTDQLPSANTVLVVGDGDSSKVVGHVINAARSAKTGISFLAIIKHEYAESSNIQLFDSTGPKILISPVPYAITN